MLIEYHSLLLTLISLLCCALANAINAQQQQRQQQTHFIYAIPYAPIQQNSYLSRYAIQHPTSAETTSPFNTNDYYAITPTTNTQQSTMMIGFQQEQYAPTLSRGMPDQKTKVKTEPVQNQWPPHQQQKHWQQHLNYQQQQYQSELDQQRRGAAPEIIQQHRNEGNFYRKPNSTKPTAERKHELESRQSNGKQAQANEQQYERKRNFVIQHAGHAAFEHKVVHITTPQPVISFQDYRKRRSFPSKRFTNVLALNDNVEHSPVPKQKRQTQVQTTQHFQDIFMHYASPQSLAYGHVDYQPLHFAQRFESLDKGNRYRGEIIWADAKTGGYGTQHWDMAQGKL